MLVWLFSSFVLLSEDFKPDKRNSIIQTFMGSLTESSKKDILEQVQGGKVTQLDLIKFIYCLKPQT